MTLHQLLLNRKIVNVRYMTKNEVDNHMWSRAAIVITLDNGVSFYPSKDEEGNEAGVLFTTHGEFQVI